MSEGVSRAISLVFAQPLEASGIGEMVSRLLLRLADGLSIEEIVPGHIKALLRDGELYAVMSCTRPGKVILQATEKWSGATVTNLQLTVEVIVLTIPPEKVSAVVQSCWQGFLDDVEKLPNSSSQSLNA
jgi:hypothetical protein